MGDIIKGKCECSFETKDLYYGAGMMDEGICDVPALKNHSNKIEMKNIWKREQFPDYVFYTDPVLYDSSVAANNIQAWENKLKSHGNLCPECGNYTMKFEFLGMYD